MQRDVFENGNIELAAELVTPDFVDHAAPTGTPTGLDAIRSVVGFLHAGLDTIRYDIHQILADADLVAFRCTMSATHVRTFLGHAPTGRRFHVQHHHLLRFHDGRIAEHWANRDDQAMFRQLGIDPAGG
jgi:predicted ester cyclase